MFTPLHITVADLQQVEQFGRRPEIGPCVHTIRNQDLMVPFEGFEDGLTGRFLPNARGRLGEAASSFTRWAAKGFGGWDGRLSLSLNHTAVSNDLN